MRVLCAWCKTYLYTNPSGPPALISHGICKACKEEQLKKFRQAVDSGAVKDVPLTDV